MNPYFPYHKYGYSIEELTKIEYLFMKGTKENPIHHLSCSTAIEAKEAQFQALCAVVEYLCELDNIPNIMDYTKLFEFNEINLKPKLELNINY